jgi:hypothetical protein
LFAAGRIPRTVLAQPHFPILLDQAHSSQALQERSSGILVSQQFLKGKRAGFSSAVLVKKEWCLPKALGALARRSPPGEAFADQG